MSTDKKVGYIRVSSDGQNLDRQRVQLAPLTMDRIFEDTLSGKNTDRPGFKQLMEYLREGDELFVCSMDRLARSLKDLLSITTELKERGVAVHFLKEAMTIGPDEKSSPASNLMLAVMGAVSEFERELILERQREGIAIAKTKGVYKGRSPVDPALIDEAFRRIDSGVPVTRVARELKIGQATLFRYCSKRKTDARS